MRIKTEAVYNVLFNKTVAASISPSVFYLLNETTYYNNKNKTKQITPNQIKFVSAVAAVVGLKYGIPLAIIFGTAKRLNIIT